MRGRIEYEVIAELDDTPVRGNALASGDHAADRAAENEILARLDRGDVWAWAFVTVTAKFGSFEGRATLGACSYKDEADFTQGGGYYDDMKSEAAQDLHAQIVKAAQDVGAYLDTVAHL